MKKFIGGIAFSVGIAAFGKIMYEFGRLKMARDVCKSIKATIKE